MAMNLFAYGLLQHADVLQQLIGEPLNGEVATLPGYTRRQLLLSGFKPCAMAVPEDGHSLSGVLFRDVSPSALAAMDAFEMLDEQIYRRETVSVSTAAGENVACEVYLQGAALTDDNLGDPWCETSFMEEYYQHYVEVMVPEFLAARQIGRPQE
ncbi:gamma-glutamylcyclotransferase [Aestuariicella hydrocarbonica]|uniref:Putative gamma-glutamylcyclotransferase n=1 Tax=Pseudomaricurvus hydrocarbonicus TaxID=1470433 RepID=A0A9E5MPL0_9GAMM|nr:gamma-glutamylcyclotransferase family protein [Aestuariicella hydrocarbonica]NHO68002.1 gamma-glutamylcyclotransferase [Aestuariicella hydrocarbonica]